MPGTEIVVPTNIEIQRVMNYVLDVTGGALKVTGMEKGNNIKSANDVVMTVQSKNAAGNPTEVRYYAASVSTVQRITEVIAYDVDGDLESITRTLTTI